MRYGKQTKRAVALALCVLAGSCVAFRNITKQAPARGLVFNHTVHTVQEEMACDDCHDLDADPFELPNHDLCAVCHEFDEDEPTPESCGLCHSRADYTVTEREHALSAEINFEHTAHLEADVACEACHANPDKPMSSMPSLKQQCMDCHGGTDPKLNECSVCHSEIDVDVRPKFRGTMRLLHDTPEVWMRIHGREAKMDEAFCTMCHAEKDDCSACHERNAPADHTVTWRRRTHGLHAGWDRSRCSVCHEEDSCRKCHSKTKPRSHRRSFGHPINSHCVQCHYPPENTGCTVCHEEIEHERALPSPHIIGLYPRRCGLCHPGGLPHAAPHLSNSTTKCIVCHK